MPTMEILSIVCNPTKVAVSQLMSALANPHQCQTTIGMLYGFELWRNIRFHLSDTDGYPDDVRAAVDYLDLVTKLVALSRVDPTTFIRLEADIGGLVEEIVTEDVLARLADVYAEEANAMLTNAGQPGPMDENKAPPPSSHIGFFDGGAAPKNPGPCGSGWVLYDGAGKPVCAGTAYRKHGTNNEAEYDGLLGLLKELNDRRIDTATIIGDSSTVIKQLTGENRCRAENLRPLYEEATDAVGGKLGWTFQHMKREHNKVADKLCDVARRAKRADRGLHLLQQ